MLTLVRNVPDGNGGNRRRGIKFSAGCVDASPPGDSPWIVYFRDQSGIQVVPADDQATAWRIANALIEREDVTMTSAELRPPSRYKFTCVGDRHRLERYVTRRTLDRLYDDALRHGGDVVI